MARKSLKEVEVTPANMAFKEGLSDLPLTLKKTKGERDIEKELLGKWTPDTVIDAFEKQQGIGRGKVEKPLNVEKRSRVLDFEDADDLGLFNQLMNSLKYNILFWERNWTVQGTLKVFVIYTVDLDYKEEPKKNESNQTK